jgi:DNA mismatch repair protein MutL
MFREIQALPDEVIQLIAAGEVIDSLAAAVRELVENALDAGATRIIVALWPKRWQVTVTDNGCGMQLPDLEQAAVPHATSKIRDCEDLLNIQSLGFRGEALHSLALLGDLEIRSRPQESSAGWRVVYNHQGEAVVTEPVAIATGTIVTALNLFGTWAARRQGLPPLAQQLRAVQTTLQNLVLCHPWITWQIQQDERDWFAIWPGETAQQILPQFLPNVQTTDLHTSIAEVNLPQAPEQNGTDHQENSPSGSGQLQLVIGLPDRCHRYRPDWVRVAINHRVVQIPELEQSILRAFTRTLPRHRFPICFVHLFLSPHIVDWNRHPAKLEVYLHDLAYWQQQVEQAITQTLSFAPVIVPGAFHTHRVGQLLKTAEAKGGYSASRTLQPLAPLGDYLPQAGDEEMPSDLTPLIDRHRTELRAVAQIHQTYILAEHPAGLWLVEQHIAHERVLYEKLCDRWQLIPLKSPAILSKLTQTQLEQLQRVGLEVDLFGDQTWAVRTAPELLAEREDCTEALWELSLGGDLQAAQVATACRTAIRNGTSLILSEMQSLLDQWQQTRHPRTCPHGRPIYLSLEESSLSRFFRRHWVIGKSHGI